jgi:CheY-like chemotaxis protein
MDEETLARATEPFFTTKGVGKGTGLGLSMAQSFAAQSGGQFVIQSRKGDGTVAELWLPVAVVPVAVDPEVSDARETSRTTEATPGQTGQTRALVILVVDDDRLALMNTTATLNKLGHRVYTALSGEQALAAMRREEGINLVMIDHALPDMKGEELAEVIRTDWPALPIIFATPLADASVQQVAKPLRDEDLLKAIARAAASTGAERSGSGRG